MRLNSADWRARTGRALLPAVLIVLVCLALRWADLYSIPLFIDEATGINRARDTWYGYIFQGLPRGKWLTPFVISWFKPFGPETLWISRSVTVLLSCLTCAGAIGLGRAFDRETGTRGVGVLTGLLYAALPYTLFYDRQALADPMLSALMALLLVASYRLGKRPSVLLALMAGVLIALAVLAKLNAAIFVFIPLLSVLLLTPRPAWRHGAALALAAPVVALAVILAVLVAADSELGVEYSLLRPQTAWANQEWSVHTDLNEEAISPDRLLRQWRYNYGTIRGYISTFYGWPVAVAAALSAAWMIWTPRPSGRRLVVWLWLVAGGSIVPYLAVIDWVSARYIGFVTMPALVLASLTAVLAGEWLYGRLPVSTYRPWMAASLLGLGIAVGFLPITVTLLTNPYRLRAPDAIYRGYFIEGTNLSGMHNDLLVRYRESGRPVHVIFREVGTMHLQAFWGGYAGSLVPWDGSPGQAAAVARWLNAGDSVAFLDVSAIPDSPFGATLATIGTYPHTAGGKTFRLRLLSEPGSSLRFAQGNEIFGNPYALESDYRALAATLPEAGISVFMYPPHQAEVLAGLSAARPIPLDPEYTLDLAGVDASLRDAAALPGARIVTVFWNEVAGDPDRTIEARLNSRLFRLGEQWIGVLRRVEYVVPPAEFQMRPLEARFGTAIAIEQAGVMVNRDYNVLLVELQARALEAVDGSYKTATFVMDGQGSVVAQYDGVPVGFLRPTTDWQPGEQVVDRYAIALPADLPAGDYRVLLAYYDEATLARLPLDPPGEPGDLLPLGEIAVE